MFRGVGNSAAKCIFNLLKAFNLCERKSVIERESYNNQYESERGKWQ